MAILVHFVYSPLRKESRNSSGAYPCPRRGTRHRPAHTTEEIIDHDDGNIFTCTVVLYGSRFVSIRVMWCSHTSPLIFASARNTPPMQQKIPWVQNRKPRLQKTACAHGTPGAGCDRGEDAKLFTLETSGLRGVDGAEEPVSTLAGDRWLQQPSWATGEKREKILDGRRTSRGLALPTVRRVSPIPAGRRKVLRARALLSNPRLFSFTGCVLALLFLSRPSSAKKLA